MSNISICNGNLCKPYTIAPNGVYCWRLPKGPKAMQLPSQQTSFSKKICFRLFFFLEVNRKVIVRISKDVLGLQWSVWIERICLDIFGQNTHIWFLQLPKYHFIFWIFQKDCCSYWKNWELHGGRCFVFLFAVARIKSRTITNPHPPKKNAWWRLAISMIQAHW